MPPPRPERGRLLAAALVLAFGVAACGALTVSPPPPAPESFPGIAGRLGQFGINVESWTSGDSGCDDASLNPTAIRFTADGLDQPTPLTLRIYIFADRAAWDRRLADVDTCAGKWATDPSAFQILQTSPYVVTGQGPWPPEFADAVQKAIHASAGSGG
jgi:hypothetical protein